MSFPSQVSYVGDPGQAGKTLHHEKQGISYPAPSRQELTIDRILAGEAEIPDQKPIICRPLPAAV